MSERFSVVWTDVAVNDLLAIVEYVADHNGVGVAVPELSAEGIHAYRELVVGPYRVMFALRGDDAVVLATIDGRRDVAELLIERALTTGCGE